MLTRIISLTVRDIRSWAGQHTFEFNDGVTVLHGRNQIGKSTLALALMMTLAYSAKSPKTRSELLPLQGGAPMSSVTFAAGGEVYTITKVWGHVNDSVLRQDGVAEPIATGDLAEAQSAELAFGLAPQQGNFGRNKTMNEELKRRLADSVATLMFHLQGTLSDAMSMTGDLASIGLVVDEQELARALGKVAAASLACAKEIRSSDTARATGDLVNAERVLAELSESVAEAEAIANELEQKESLLREREDNVPTDEGVQQGREQAEALRERAAAHQRERESSATALGSATAEHAPRQKRLDDRRTLETDLGVKAENVSTTKETVSISRERSALLTEQLRVATDLNTRLVNELTVVKSWEVYEAAAATSEILRRDVATAEQDKERRVQLQSDLASMESELQNIRLPSSEEWQKFNDARAEKSALEAQRSIRVEVVGPPPKGCSILADGKPVVGDSEVADVVTFDGIAGPIAHVRTLTGGGHSVEDIQGRINALLNDFGVENAAELRVRQDRKQELETLIKERRATLEALPSPESLETIIATKTLALETASKAPSGPRPEGELAELRMILEARSDEANDRHHQAERASREASEKLAADAALHDAAVQAHTSVEVVLEDHVQAFGTTQDLVEAELVSRTALEEAQLIHTNFEAAKEFEEDALLAQAANLQRQLDETDGLRLEVVQLRERVLSLRNHPDLLRLSDLEAEVVVQQTEVARLKLEYEAFQGLYAAAVAAQHEAQVESRSQVTDRLEQLLEYLWGGPLDTVLTEEGAPQTVGGVPFDSESHGAREQYNLVLRLVLLELLQVSNDGEAATLNASMILDDSLVNTSQSGGRLERTRNMLKSMVDQEPGLQLIVFTHRPDDYSLIVDDQIDLGLRR